MTQAAASPHDPGHDHTDHAHAHDPYLAHHFHSRDQQMGSAKLGMWVFLATEILMFGGLFVAYAVYRGNHAELFHQASFLLDTTMGAINTVVLIASSFTMAWAVRAAQLNQRRLCTILLSLTLAGGCGFMVIKYFEYEAKISHGIGPGPLWDTEKIEHWVHAHHDDGHGGGHGAATGEGTASADMSGGAAAESAPSGGNPGAEAVQVSTDYRTALPEPGETRHGLVADADASEDEHTVQRGSYVPESVDEAERMIPFIDIYFSMTGLHGLHVLIGMGLIGWILFRNVAGAFGSQYYTPVDLVGLYWHLVDLIWIFLFPLLYLID